ncbi:MAG: alpha/beta hydrolase [Citromicrobium sp.]|nr:alpha/beta hydrolase [Citromicrobium sp.]
MPQPRDGKRADHLAPSFGSWLRELPNLPIIWSSPIRPVRLPSGTAPAREARPPVMVLPGILSNDAATSLMRRTLDAAGYEAFPSKLGLVTGITAEIFAKAEARLDEIYTRTGAKVILIGISLGGLYARVLAQRHPEKVALVMTLGTPFSGDRRANNAWRVYEAINDHKVDNPPLSDDPRQKPPVRTIAVWSPFDGVIAPACSRGEEGECDLAIEVPERHFEFSASRRSIERILAILEQERAGLED